jgi:hypothetical protein
LWARGRCPLATMAMRMRRRRYISTRGRDHVSHNDLIKTSAMQALWVTVSRLTGAGRGLQAESAGPQSIYAKCLSGLSWLDWFLQRVAHIKLARYVDRLDLFFLVVYRVNTRQLYNC